MTTEQKQIGLLDLVALVLSVYVLGALVISAFVQLDPELARLLELIDNGVCFFFLGDFFLRLWKADSKLEFLKWGWIDFLSSIPTLDMFRGGRLFRIVRLFRILRAFRSAKQIMTFAFQSRASGTFGSVAIVALLLVIFASIAILQVETDPNSNIKSAEDALWWS